MRRGRSTDRARPVECVHVETGRVEVTRLFFGGHETPVDPHPQTAHSSEKAERVGETVQLAATSRRPPNRSNTSSHVACWTPEGSNPAAGSDDGIDIVRALRPPNHARKMNLCDVIRRSGHLTSVSVNVPRRRPRPIGAKQPAHVGSARRGHDRRALRLTGGPSIARAGALDP